MTGEWTVATPAWLLLAAALPVIGWLRARRGRPVLVVPFASQWSTAGAPRSRIPEALVVAGIVMLAVALARPQQIDPRRQTRREGYDILLAIDLSGSMLAEDYVRDGRPLNRLQAIAPIIEAFIANRPDDRIGIVAFSGRAYTLAPLTADHDWLQRQVDRLQVGLIEDGTAIGDALALATRRLEQPDRLAEGLRPGGFIVLLTDGANNAGAVAPLEAAARARAAGIPVYTIGAGQDGFVPMPVFDAAGRRLGTREVVSDLDEPTMQMIADMTGGRYFRAADADTVAAGFAMIDRERKIEFDAARPLRAEERYAWFAVPGLLLVALGYAAARRPAAGRPLRPAAVEVTA